MNPWDVLLSIFRRDLGGGRFRREGLNTLLGVARDGDARVGPRRDAGQGR